MKFLKSFTFIVFSLFLLGPLSYAVKGTVATLDDIEQIKEDILDRKIQIQVTRLKDFEKKYGDPATFNDTAQTIVYDYKGLVLTFSKQRYFRNWEQDTFKEAVYTEDINNLRSDLQSKKIVGDYVSLDKFREDYGEPTEIYETSQDGDISIYYWGDIKCSFENFYVIESWKSSDLERKEKTGLLESKSEK